MVAAWSHFVLASKSGSLRLGQNPPAHLSSVPAASEPFLPAQGTWPHTLAQLRDRCLMEGLALHRHSTKSQPLKPQLTCSPSPLRASGTLHTSASDLLELQPNRGEPCTAPGLPVSLTVVLDVRRVSRQVPFRPPHTGIVPSTQALQGSPFPPLCLPASLLDERGM